MVTVAAYKGGIGKSTLAYELAYALDAVLVDLDWDRGGNTRQWGYRAEDHSRALLLDALERGTTPRPLVGRFKPDLVPSHPDLSDNQPTAEVMADSLSRWAKEWDRTVVVDTHPGGVPLTFGAMAAARAVIVPTVLATKELEALEGMLDELPDYPIMVIPNKVSPVPPAAEIDRLGSMVRKAGVKVGPPVSNYAWLPRRKLRRAICSYDPVPARIKPLADELRAVAEAVSQ